MFLLMCSVYVIHACVRITRIRAHTGALGVRPPTHRRASARERVGVRMGVYAGEGTRVTGGGITKGTFLADTGARGGYIKIPRSFSHSLIY